MSREDLIARANAALRLGDWFIPPKGSVIALDAERYVVVSEGSRNEKQWNDELARGVGVQVNHAFDIAVEAQRSSIWTIWVGGVFEILELPRGPVSPFEDWPRPFERYEDTTLVEEIP